MTKIKKKNLSEISLEKKNQRIKKKSNPFEVHINKNKQQILGQKNKADKGLPGVSRAKAIKKRKGTLLQEYKLKNKDNVFLDKRIGEKNVHMTQEDRAIARFTAERIKAHKKKMIYNLNDEEILTHKGQTLEEIEKFDDPKSDDSDDDTRGNLDKNFVDGAHFGGGLLSKSDSFTSRNDLISQLIIESKKRKAERQKIREETVNLTAKLDSEWKDLLPVISSSKVSNKDSIEKPKADDYDIAVNQLKFEAKGTPSDRLKSEEEIIKEEKDKLVQLETDRLERMKEYGHDSKNKQKHKSVEDLDDSFMVESIDDNVPSNEGVDNTHQILDETTNTNYEKNENDLELQNIVEDQEQMQMEINKEKEHLKDIEDIDDSSSCTEDNLSDLKESESSSEDDITMYEKNVNSSIKHSEESNDKNAQNNSNTLSMYDKEIIEKVREELPYTYKVPENVDELEKLMQNHNPEYQSIIVERIIKCNHWLLDGRNKEKLSKFFAYLLQYINNCALVNEVNDIYKFFHIFDRLCPYFYDLAHINSENTKICVQEIIQRKYNEFEKNKKKYPGLDTLFVFKLVSLLFPTSDFRHAIVTPCLIFMSQILSRSRVKDKSDLARGLFISTLMLEYTVLSKRFAPSVINFLCGILYTATPKHLIQGVKIIHPFKTIGKLCNLLVVDKKQMCIITDQTALLKADDLIQKEIDDEFKVKSLLTTLNVITEFKNHLQELEAAYSIFEPIHKLLQISNFKKYPSNVRKHAVTLCTELEKLKFRKLEYIVMEKKRPKPLRLYEPAIKTVYDDKRRTFNSKDKAEQAKLLHKYKKEAKGAIREIRRDTAFLSKVQIKQQIRNDIERKRKVKEIFSEAAMQQSEINKIKRKK